MLWYTDPTTLRNDPRLPGEDNIWVEFKEEIGISSRKYNMFSGKKVLL